MIDAEIFLFFVEFSTSSKKLTKKFKPFFSPPKQKLKTRQKVLLRPADGRLLPRRLQAGLRRRPGLGRPPPGGADLEALRPRAYGPAAAVLLVRLQGAAAVGAELGPELRVQGLGGAGRGRGREEGGPGRRLVSERVLFSFGFLNSSERERESREQREETSRERRTNERNNFPKTHFLLSFSLSLSLSLSLFPSLSLSQSLPFPSLSPTTGAARSPTAACCSTTESSTRATPRTQRASPSLYRTTTLYSLPSEPPSSEGAARQRRRSS